MALDIGPFGLGALVFYGLAYVTMRWRLTALDRLLTNLHEGSPNASESYINRWAFQARSDREMVIRHLFTRQPGLMVIITVIVGLVTVWTLAFAFTHISVAVGALILVILLFLFPFYHAADAFDVYFMTRAAQKAGVEKLSKEDAVRLEQERVALNVGKRYFGRLFLIMLPTLAGALIAQKSLGNVSSQILYGFPSWVSFILFAIILAVAILIASKSTRH